MMIAYFSLFILGVFLHGRKNINIFNCILSMDREVSDFVLSNVYDN